MSLSFDRSVTGVVICAPRASGKSRLADRLGWLDADVFLNGCALPSGPEVDPPHYQAAGRLIRDLNYLNRPVAVTDLSPRVFPLGLFAGLRTVASMPSLRDHELFASLRRSVRPIGDVRVIRAEFEDAVAAVGMTMVPWSVLINLKPTPNGVSLHALLHVLNALPPVAPT